VSSHCPPCPLPSHYAHLDLPPFPTRRSSDLACTNPDPADLSSCVPNPSGAPPGTRLICGTARTNQTSADVNWAVTVTDNGGKNTDIFSIQVPDLVYHRSGFLQGGNIQLHKPIFSGTQPSTCPALVAGPTRCL